MKGASKSSKGSALLTAIAIMTVLVVIAMGSISASFSNMQISKIISDNERCYYAAEDAAEISISVIKDEVTKYYMEIGQSASQSTYLTMYENFFPYLAGRLTGENSILSDPDFVESELDGITTVTCTMSEPTLKESGVNGVTFTVTCTSVIDDVPRTVIGTLDVEAQPVTFQYTTAPVITDETLILGGDILVSREDNENKITIEGDARIGGTVLDDSATFSTGTVSTYDFSVEEDLIWQLFWEQFDTSIADPYEAPVINLDGQPAQLLVSNDYYFTESTTYDTANVVTKNIYCDGDLTIKNIDVINSQIYATGNVYIIDEDMGIQNNTIYGTNIYAGGDIYIELADIVNNQNNRRYYTAGGDIILKIGKYVDNKDGSIEYGSFKAGGNIYVSSLTENDNDNLIECQFYANGNITTGTPGGPIDPTIENIAHCTFETAYGDITLHTATMHSSSKVFGGGNVVLANKGVSDSEVYAEGYIHFDGTAWYTYDDLSFRSYNTKYCAHGDIIIEHANFDSCYFYAGNDMYIIMTSGNSIIECVMYAEGDIIYANDWNGFMDTMVSTLVYTNSDFYFSGRGTEVTYTGTGISKASGMQLMVLGDIYSYEADDTETEGYWGTFSKPELDILRFGDEGTSEDLMDTQAIADNIGEPNEALGILADVLYAAGFEHYLPEPIIILPLYTEVFKNEGIYEQS
jgi:Tfp pilus assembly protein PilX